MSHSRKNTQRQLERLHLWESEQTHEFLTPALPLTEPGNHSWTVVCVLKRILELNFKRPSFPLLFLKIFLVCSLATKNSNMLRNIRDEKKNGTREWKETLFRKRWVRWQQESVCGWQSEGGEEDWGPAMGTQQGKAREARLREAAEWVGMY